ncbi:hypothetical protein [Streptomyces sp. NPDC024089]|uniref:hypothetical protein n=1 Tax=Streptomyces sp. NPDC024089 TaxID=3154328 RepID=UPI0033E94568
MTTLSLDRFRDQHGDLIRWCGAEIDSCLTIGEIAPPAPPLYSCAETLEQGWAERSAA